VDPYSQFEFDLNSYSVSFFKPKKDISEPGECGGREGYVPNTTRTVRNKSIAFSFMEFAP
jgi:hypothetical protein